MENIKEHIGIDLDLSVCALETAINLFKDKFKFLPDRVEVCIEDILVVGELKRRWFDEHIKFNFDLKNLWFHCDRDFPQDYWQVCGYIDSKRYIIYSNGA